MVERGRIHILDLPDSFLQGVYGLHAPSLVARDRQVCKRFRDQLLQSDAVYLKVKRGSEDKVKGSMLLRYVRNVTISCGNPDLLMPAILVALRGGWTGLVALHLENRFNLQSWAQNVLPSTLHTLQLERNSLGVKGTDCLARVLRSLTGLQTLAVV